MAGASSRGSTADRFAQVLSGQGARV